MNRSEESIAIVGMGGLFPGSPDLETFWSNIAGKVDTCAEVPEGRWPLAPEEFFHATPGLADRVYSTRACLLADIPPPSSDLQIDRAAMGKLDPLEALALYVGAQCFHDVVGAALNRERTGVILANIVLPTDSATALTREIFGRGLEVKTPGLSSNSRDTGGELPRPPMNPAGLLTKALGLGGGSMTLDAACASSLYALHLAVRAGDTADDIRLTAAVVLLSAASFGEPHVAQHVSPLEFAAYALGAAGGEVQHPEAGVLAHLPNDVVEALRPGEIHGAGLQRHRHALDAHRLAGLHT
ncbi:hypothetical protein IIC65_07360 [Candidatus Sumerlaeota bacterium]|nr:hypothetical protein [Candidatus Sumerlaeota bacterium]